jgi:hypothetical protein
MRKDRALGIRRGAKSFSSRELRIKISFSAAAARAFDFVSISHPATADKNKSRPGECQYRLDDYTTRLSGPETFLEGRLR